MNEHDIPNRDGAAEAAGKASGPEASAAPETPDEELERLRRLVGQYREREAARALEEQRAAEHEALSRRMDAALGGRRFAHERLREDVLEDFRKALGGEGADGRTDREILEALTKGRHYFASQHPAPRMAPFGRVRDDGGAVNALRRAFGLPAKD